MYEININSAHQNRYENRRVLQSQDVVKVSFEKYGRMLTKCCFFSLERAQECEILVDLEKC